MKRRKMKRKSKSALKSCKILIRVSKAEKKQVESIATERGENVSQFYRRLLKEEGERKLLETHLVIAEQEKKVLKELNAIKYGVVPDTHGWNYVV